MTIGTGHHQITEAALTMIRRFCARLVILLIATVPSAAEAASFDCTHTKPGQEKLICTNPELSQLDSTLERTYRADLARLSEGGRVELQQSERAWLRQVRTYCSANAKEQQQADCLITAYNARLKSLEHAAVKMGPFVFRSVDILQADETTHAMTEVSYPQIDQPITATTTTWNRLIARDFARLTAPNSPPICEGNAGEFITDYRMMTATDRLISVTFSAWMACNGAAHGDGNSWSSTMLLSPTVRPLKLDDILDPSKPWQEFLTNWTIDYIRHHIVNGYFGGTPMCRSGHGADCPVDEDAINAIATESQYDLVQWSMTKTGLVIDHQPGRYALGIHSIETPWTDVAPYLRADAPVPR
jgi:uncharacterized protein